MPILPSGGARFIEVGGASAAAVTPVVLRDDTGLGWDATATTPAQAACYDLGDGQWTIMEIDNPYVIIDDGAAGYVIATAGTATAVLADDGLGGFLVAATGAGVKGALYLDGGQREVSPVRLDAPALVLLDVGAAGISSL